MKELLKSPHWVNGEKRWRVMYADPGTDRARTKNFRTEGEAHKWVNDHCGASGSKSGNGIPDCDGSAKWFRDRLGEIMQRIAAGDNMPTTLAQARTMAQLASAAQKLIDNSDLEERVASIEKCQEDLKSRRSGVGSESSGARILTGDAAKRLPPAN